MLDATNIFIIVKYKLHQRDIQLSKLKEHWDENNKDEDTRMNDVVKIVTYLTSVWACFVGFSRLTKKT